MRDRLEAIVSTDAPCNDPVEFCCELVSLQTGVKSENKKLYIEQAECVQAELERLGLNERSKWLAKIRSDEAR
jgi:hypothetical protein